MNGPTLASEEPNHVALLVELMIAYQGGEVAAFETFYRLLEPGLRRFIAAHCPQANLVRDLVQDTFLEMHRSRQTYLPPLPVQPWAFGIARNVLARNKRLESRRQVETREPQEGLDSFVARQANSAIGIDLREVERALEDLSTGTRTVWLLHHVEGLSFQKIAGQLGIGVTAAKLRSSRAMRALRAALGIKGRRGR